MLLLLDMSSLNENMTEEELFIVKSWRNSDSSPTIVSPLPQKLAERYHIEKPAHLYFIARDDGILLRKLDLKGIK
jgi:hypothetical protein